MGAHKSFGMQGRYRNDISPADHNSTHYWAACYSIQETAGHAMSCDLRPVRTATLCLAVQIVCFTSRLCVDSTTNYRLQTM